MNTQRMSSGGARRELAGLSFVLVGLGLGVVLLSATPVLYRAQGQLAAAVGWLPLGYAFAAGTVAAVNPCGVLLLPSLAAYALAYPSLGPLTARVPRALALGSVATLGFLALFGVVGLVIATGGYALARAFPYGGVLIGGALVVVGTWLALSGRDLGIRAATRVWERLPPGRDLASFFGFGMAYGVCSLACTLPVFLAVVGTALSRGGPTEAAGQFVGYALGMGTTLTAVLLGVTLFEATVTRWLRAAVPYVHRLAAAFLLAAGVFTVGYWWKAF